MNIGNIGPFDLRHIIIGALIILVVGVAMFLLKQFLSFGFVLPIWMLVIIFMTISVIIAVLLLTIMGYNRWGPEGFLFATARKKDIPIGVDVELGSSKAEFYLMEKEDPKDIVLKDEEAGTKVDPAMLDSHCKPMAFPLGLDIYILTYYNFMAQSIQNHAAFKAIIDDFETNPKREVLRFLTNKEYCELISDPEHYLERNATVKLNKYFTAREMLDSDGNTVYSDQERKIPKITHVRRFETVVNGETVLMEQDISLSEILRALHIAREEVARMPIVPGLIAGTEAFKNNSVAYSAQHLSHVLMLYYSKIMDDMKGKLDIMTYAIAGLLILVGGGVVIYIISIAAKNFGG